MNLSFQLRTHKSTSCVMVQVFLVLLPGDHDVSTREDEHPWHPEFRCRRLGQTSDQILQSSHSYPGSKRNGQNCTYPDSASSLYIHVHALLLLGLKAQWTYGIILHPSSAISAQLSISQKLFGGYFSNLAYKQILGHSHYMHNKFIFDWIVLKIH